MDHGARAGLVNCARRCLRCVCRPRIRSPSSRRVEAATPAGESSTTMHSEDLTPHPLRGVRNRSGAGLRARRRSPKPDRGRNSAAAGDIEAHADAVQRRGRTPRICGAQPGQRGTTCAVTCTSTGAAQVVAASFSAKYAQHCVRRHLDRVSMQRPGPKKVRRSFGRGGKFRRGEFLGSNGCGDGSLSTRHRCSRRSARGSPRCRTGRTALRRSPVR